MHAALVVMAAGLGSRYGGVKQVERVGPRGEILMEYAIYDAVRAGFDRIVVILKPEMIADAREAYFDRIEKAGVELCFACQSVSGSWRDIPIPAGRTKPLGTVHALLSAAEYLDRPFAVINADDYYGRESLNCLSRVLPELRSGGDAAMVAYRLKNTVSPHGTVTRGVCAVEDGYLRGVTETYHIGAGEDGLLRGDDGAGAARVLDPDGPVSMNLWAFHTDFMNSLAEVMTRFLKGLDRADNRSECLLPAAVDERIASGTLRCRALDTEDHWFGMTYPQDKAAVVEELRGLHAAGVYPDGLWN
ncbi:MAG: NTP transferase domain-containing protein [Oscillospiraceae bacterium]|nr:NTP transferase domain-containing protein [Oscillospiraceae bacterium]